LFHNNVVDAYRKNQHWTCSQQL